MRTSSFFAKKPSNTLRVKIDRVIAQLRGGIHRSVISGKGIEFKRLRPYSPLDPPTAIDDMASSRLSEDPIFEPYSRVRYTPRQISTVVLLDAGETMRAPRIKEEIAATVFWFLALSSFRAMDRFRVIPYSSSPLGDSDWVTGEDGLTEFLVRYGIQKNPQTKLLAASSVYSYVSFLELHDAALFILSDFAYPQNDELAVLQRLGIRERNIKCVFCAIDEWSEFISTGYSMGLCDPISGRMRAYSPGELGDMRMAAMRRLDDMEKRVRPLGATCIRMPVLGDSFSVFQRSLRLIGFM